MNALARVPRPLWRPLVVTAALAVLGLGYHLWAVAAGAAKIAPDALAGARPAVAVEVNIAPEAYHMARMQEAGRLVRTDPRVFYIADARPAEIQALARAWWVAAVRSWDQQ